MTDRPVFTAPTRSARADDAASPRAGDAARFLLPRGTGPQARTKRLFAALGVVLVLGAVALNAGLYHGTRQRLEREGWAQLRASADMRRNQVETGLAVLLREAGALADDPVVHERVSRMAAGRLTPSELDDLTREFDTARRHYELENVQVFGGTGAQPLYEASPTSDPERVAMVDVVRRARAMRSAVVGDPIGDELMVAVPAVDDSGEVNAVLVVHRIDTGLLAPDLGRWPGLGDASGAFLTRPEGDDAVVLTPPPLRGSAPVGTRIPRNNSPDRPAVLAAAGIESDAEFTAPTGEPMWAVTRRVPGAGWGLVAVASRADVLAGLNDTVRGLALLDAGLALGLLALVVIWRRLYATALSRQAMDLTGRHPRRVQGVFDNAFDAIFTFDRWERLRSVNRAAAALFGLPPEALDGAPVGRFLRWDANGATGLPETGAVGVGEVIAADGRRIPVEYTLGVTDAGEELVYTAVVRDISERVEADERVRAFADGLEATNRQLAEVNAQLEEASRLKTEFLANTSHELRTPLNGMIGFLQLVIDGMCDSPEEERDFLQQALACSRHLLGLINDVLDIARIEAGKLTLQIEALDVQQLFEEVETLTHVQATQRDLQLDFSVELEPGCRPAGDFAKAKQVLVNLVGNSLKFTHQGGIRVRAYSRRELGHILFEVVDTGIGIAASRQGVIFEKFVQGDGSTTRRFGGTGLGLAISRSLVETMGGIIGVQSEGEGRGTRMYFSLPLWREASEAVPATEPAAAGEVRIRGPEGAPLVLVVDDDRVFRRFVSETLVGHGYRAVEAADAEQGWATVLSLRPACVLLDYALTTPEGATLRSGWDLAQRLASEPTTRHLPVIFVTGFDGELKDKLRATRFSRRPEHVVKPVEGPALIARLESLVPVAPGKAVRVLMAEDDPGVATFVSKVLPADRFVLRVTRDGGECLAALRADPQGWDVMLLDLMMPEVSGYEVLREMTLAGLRPDLPVIVLTNFPEPRDADEARLLQSGLVVEVMSKAEVHSTPALLPQALATCLRASGAHAPAARADRTRALPEAA